MPFRRLKIFDATGRLLYDSRSQREDLAVIFTKAEQFGTPAFCKAEELLPTKWESLREGILFVVELLIVVVGMIALILLLLGDLI